MSGRDRMVERQILKAQAEGKLSGLAGEGRPLPERPEAALVDTGTAVGFRIMAEAGALPEEIVLKKQADALRAAWSAETDEVRRKALMAELAQIEMKRAIAEDARRKFLR
ncbi:MAG: DUF1992 domain-containing protein [Rhodobacteraceae bacterium]|nr:DUF1992 domain-containing protein [Paracoccaceae bacterium]